MVISLNKLAGSTGVPQEVQLAFVPIPAGQTNEASGEEPSCIYAWKYLTLGPQMLLSQILQHKSYAFALLGQAYVQRSNCKPRLPAFLPIRWAQLVETKALSCHAY